MPRPSLDPADLRLLKVFVQVVDAGGFASAEVVLGISLSTISSQIKTLETRLGLSLCRRGRAGFALTEAGEAVYAEARQLIAASETFSSRVAGLRDRLAGPVRVGLVDSTVTDPNSHMVRAFADYARIAPDSEIRLVSNPPDQLLRDVTDQELDVAVGSFPRLALGLEYVDIYDERHHFYCGREHPLFGAPDAAIDFDEVRKYRLIARRYWGSRDIKVFAGNRIGATVAAMEPEAILILTGRFLGYLPTHFAATWVTQGLLRDLAPARFGYTAPFQITYWADRLKLPRVAALVSAILTAHGKPPPGQSVRGPIGSQAAGSSRR
ncbi:MAG: LysR family transcriptional regulator [Rhodobacterales bacterium]|nr:LysR family transcriptional regulator [Rhodobacterales bacterium]